MKRPGRDRDDETRRARRVGSYSSVRSCVPGERPRAARQCWHHRRHAGCHAAIRACRRSTVGPQHEPYSHPVGCLAKERDLVAELGMIRSWVESYPWRADSQPLSFAANSVRHSKSNAKPSRNTMKRFDATTKASERQSTGTIRVSVTTTSESKRTGGDW